MRVLLLAFLVVMCHTTFVLSQIRGQYKWTIRHPNGPKNKLVGFVGEANTVVIGIKGDRDGHIIVTPGKDLTSDVFEYIVGGWGNRKTKISLWGWLSGRYRVILNQLSPRQYRYFWLDWSDGLYLKAGTGTDPNDVSTFTIAEPLQYKRPMFLSLSAFHNTVYYQIVKATNPCFMPIATYNRLKITACSAYKPRGEHLSTLYNPDRKLSPTTYRTVGFLGGMTSLMIQVMAPSNGHVVLSASSTDLTKNLFEYVIGGTTNDASGFRTPIFGEDLEIRYDIGPVLNKIGYRWFWFDWSDGFLRAGDGSVPGDYKTKNCEVPLKLNPAAYPRFLSLSAYHNSVKYIVIKGSSQCYLSLDEYKNREKCGKKRPNKKKCLMWNCCWDSKDRFCYKKKHGEYHWVIHNHIGGLNAGTYETVGYIAGMKSLVFHVKGDRDGHVLLAQNRNFKHPFEVVIGCCGDTGVAIRSGIYGTLVTEDRSIHNILSSQHYSAFWLDWSDGQYLRFGPGTTPRKSQWLQALLSKATSDLRTVSLSSWGNVIEYKMFRAQNKCFLSMRHSVFVYGRVQCGHVRITMSECLNIGCCWDRARSICFYD